MATSRKSADYDPVEEALDLGYGLGREQERGKSREAATSAAKSARRKESASKNKQQARERSERHQRTLAQQRSRRAAREAEVARARRGAYRAGQAANRQVSRESELASARRGAYAAGRADTRRAGTGDGAGVTGSGPSLSAPDFTLFGGQLDRSTGARIIIVAVSASALGVVYRDAITGSTPDKTIIQIKPGQVLAVPTHLRSFAGVFIAGTVCLVVNEVSPPFAVMLALILLFDVAISAYVGKDGLFTRLGNGFMARGATSAKAAVPSKGSSGQSGIPSRGGAPSVGSGGSGGGGGSW